MNAKRKGTLLNKNRLRIFRFAFSFICVFLAAAVNPNRLLAQKNSSVISIDNAESTEYRKNPDSGNEEIILSGSVILSVTSGKSKTTISASRVTYDRVTEMLFASGNVTLRQTGGSEGGQDVTAQTLLFNARTMEGIFDGGRVVQTKSDAINLPSDSTLIVSSKIFGRDTSGTIAFKNVIINRMTPAPAKMQNVTSVMMKNRTGKSGHQTSGFYPAANLLSLTQSSLSETSLFFIFRHSIIPKTNWCSILPSATTSGRGIFFRQQHIFWEENLWILLRTVMQKMT